MCAKWSAGMGLFPAFWFWGCVNEPLYNEIDIMESTGCPPNQTTTRDWIRPCEVDTTGITSGKPSHYCNYADRFHWFGVEWDKDKITWYIDRKVVAQYRNTLTWPGISATGITNPMVLTINLQLVSETTEHYGCIIDTTIFPAYYYIDQVNAYKLRYDCKKVVNEILNYDNPQLPNYYNCNAPQFLSQELK
jgi:beta-glucanase (GH16 family)